MSKLEKEFEQCAVEVNDLPERPCNEDLLSLYAYYKQATKGDVTGKRPGMLNIAGRAKYDAWAEIEGTEAEVAMQHYIDLVRALQESQA